MLGTMISLAACGGGQGRAAAAFVDDARALRSADRDAQIVDCENSTYRGLGTADPLRKPGYFVCWSKSAAATAARDLVGALMTDAGGDRTAWVGCSDEGTDPYRCVAVSEHDGLSAMVFAVAVPGVDGLGDRLDIGFGTSPQSVEQIREALHS
jgi:hypothetical protein